MLRSALFLLLLLAPAPLLAEPVALVNAGACLEPATDDYAATHVALLRLALGLDPKQTIAGFVSQPSPRTTEVLSLHKTQRGGYVLRLSQLDTNTLDDASPVFTTRTRAIDARTARLISRLWKVLDERTQEVIEVGVMTWSHSPSYYFLRGGRAGQARPPGSASLLGHAIFAAQWLGTWVKAPEPGDEKDLPFIRAELNDSLARALAGEPCLRRYEP